MQRVRCRHPRPPACWQVGVLTCLVLWAVLGVVQEDKVPMVRQESYLQAAGRDSMNPKLPLSPSTPKVDYPEGQDDTEDPQWTPRRLQQLLEEPTTTCRRLTNLGGSILCEDCQTCLMDGNKYICFDPDVSPVPGDCLVYSFGVGGEMSWDAAMRHLNCSVFAFDMTLVGWGNNMVFEGLHFLDLGLGSFNSDDTINMTAADGNGKNWTSRKAHFRSLESIRDILGHKNRPIDVLKMDIEFMEWRVLADLLSHPDKFRALQDVRQIALEIHLDGLRNSTGTERVVEARKVEAVLEGLHTRGFHLAHTQLNVAQQVHAEVRGQVLPLYRESLFLRRP
ncbi:uncharacterized protein [Procambarus clarkii]|uniref:uncharacterized protein n=1 Tax=Procambarus clarkii TaxID=6728 RepID=UPI001E678BD2|nr:uncharacterized protein LOC123765062 [Procambarus clarkii]